MIIIIMLLAATPLGVCVLLDRIDKIFRIIVFSQTSEKERFVFYEENKPQINADERRFVASNLSLLTGSLDLI